MKKWIIAASISLAFSTTQAQSYSEYLLQARNALNSKDYKTAHTQFKQAFSLKLGSYIDLYDAACVAALASDKESAFKWLQQSITQGWFNLEHMKADRDLISLHEDKRWAPTIETLQSKLAAQEKNYDHKLKEQLERIFNDDQSLRQKIQGTQQQFGSNSPELNTLWDEIDKKDKANLIEVEQILKEHGWLGPQQVGRRASQTIFLVIQHASPETRVKYLPIMRQALKEKKAAASDFALLVDRTNNETGLKQIYGSQLRGKPDGGYELYPIEDPDHLDQRRVEMGLDPIAAYISRWDLKWDLAQYKEEMAKFDREQVFQVADLQALSDKLWRGELSYLDYSKNTWTSIPSNLRVTRSEQDPSVWLWSYGYDDEPHANAKDGLRLAADGKSLGDETIISRTRLHQGYIKIVTTMAGKDDGREAQFRFTYLFNKDSFERKKEVKLNGADDYFVRHVYRWK